jgi:hypothetical protein
LRESGRVTEADDAQERVDVLCAAEVWQVQNVKQARYSELQENHKVLELTGYSAPLYNRAVFTKRMALELQRDGKLTEWLDVVRLGKVAAGKGWVVGAPCFKTLVEEFEQLDEEGKLSAFPAGSSLQELWADSIISDAFLIVMDGLSQELKCKPLVDIVVCFLDWSSFFQEVPAPMENIFQVVCRSLKGFSAMLLPKPAIFDSTDQDVGFLRDTLGESSILNTDIRTKKSLVRKLRKSQTWMALYDIYDSKKGAEAEHGPGMNTREGLASLGCRFT